MWVTLGAQMGCGSAAGAIAERPELDQYLSAASAEYGLPFQLPARSAGTLNFPLGCVNSIHLWRREMKPAGRTWFGNNTRQNGPGGRGMHVRPLHNQNETELSLLGFVTVDAR